MTTLNIPVSTTKGHKYHYFQDVGATSEELWDVCHDGAGNGSGAAMQAGWKENDDWQVWLYRAYLQFDTSDIGAGTITSAKLKVSGTQLTRNASDDYLIGSASSTSYGDLKTTTDYGTFPNQGSSSGTNSWNFTDIEVSLNSSGLSGINKTGNTLLSFRGKGDTTDVYPNGADDYDYAIITSATLVVEYTPVIVDPTVTTQAVSSIDTTTATLNGNVTDTGGENVTTRGFYLAAGSVTPDSGDTVVSETGSFASGAFALSATSLIEDTLYSVAAFATNSDGTSTGSVVEFTTASTEIIRNPSMDFFTMFT